MGRIAATAKADKGKFWELHSEASELKERNDCTVKAIAIATGCTYKQAHKAMADAGRKNGKGAYVSQQRVALAALGFKMERIDLKSEVVSKYPSPHFNLQGATTHHAVRFAKVWASLPPMMMYTQGFSHVAAFRDGKVHDWTAGRAFRISTAFVITKL